jgi:hypothetical protein
VPQTRFLFGTFRFEPGHKAVVAVLPRQLLRPLSEADNLTSNEQALAFYVTMYFRLTVAILKPVIMMDSYFLKHKQSSWAQAMTLLIPNQNMPDSNSARISIILTEVFRAFP